MIHLISETIKLSKQWMKEGIIKGVLKNDRI